MSDKATDGLAGLRQHIDALDRQLLDMLNQRAHLAEQVGDIKRAEGSPFSALTVSRKCWKNPATQSWPAQK